MAAGTILSVEERLLHLLDELGIERAHVAARDAGDWQGLASLHPDRVASLSLLCPQSLDPSSVAALASRTLVIAGDHGAAAERLSGALAMVAASVSLRDYEGLMWSDLAADRGSEISSALTTFLRRVERRRPLEATRLAEGEGEIAEISYRIRGAGPPLVLMPLTLSPSQWEPIIPSLSQHYCTIELGGAYLGAVAILEARGRSVYLGMIRTLLDLMRIQPGETVLDVGCGSGVVIREIARRSAGANRLLGLDMSPYLLREARGLARRSGYGEAIEFREGRAEALPFANDSIDVVVSSTVLEEGDADRMLAEMIRVTKSGGRIGVVVRATDVPNWVNLPLSAAVKAKAEVPGLLGAGVVEGGCADAGLYRRFLAAGLTELTFFPQLSAATPAEPRLRMLQQQAMAALSGDEIAEWRQAAEQAEAEGTSFIATPHHCAVGAKP